MLKSQYNKSSDRSQ